MALRKCLACQSESPSPCCMAASEKLEAVKMERMQKIEARKAWARDHYRKVRRTSVLEAGDPVLVGSLRVMAYPKGGPHDRALIFMPTGCRAPGAARVRWEAKRRVVLALGLGKRTSAARVADSRTRLYPGDAIWENAPQVEPQETPQAS